MSQSTPDLTPLEDLATLECDFAKGYAIFNLCALLLDHTPRFEFDYRTHRDTYPGLDADPIAPILDKLPLHYTQNVAVASTHEGLAVEYLTATDETGIYPQRNRHTDPEHRANGRIFDYPEEDIDAFIDHLKTDDDTPYTDTITDYLANLHTTEDYDLDTLAFTQLVPWLPAPTKAGIDRAITEGQARYNDALDAANAQDLPTLASTIQDYYETARTKLERDLS